jgi:hypothetical protein
MKILLPYDKKMNRSPDVGKAIQLACYVVRRAFKRLCFASLFPARMHVVLFRPSGRAKRTGAA